MNILIPFQLPCPINRFFHKQVYDFTNNIKSIYDLIFDDLQTNMSATNNNLEENRPPNRLGTNVHIPAVHISINDNDPFELEFYAWLCEILCTDSFDKLLKMIMMHGYRNIRLIDSSIELLELSHRAHINSNPVNTSDDLLRKVEEERDSLTNELNRLTQHIECMRVEHLDVQTKVFNDVRTEFEAIMNRDRLATQASFDLQLRASLAEMELKFVSTNKDEMITIRAESVRHKEMYDEMCRQMDSMMHCNVVNDLKRQLAEVTEALDISRRSNYGKGAVGEHFVASCLRTIFTDCEVVDTSRTPHACDLWMHLNPGSGYFFAFECKNKVAITSKGDVSKFYSDVESLSEKHGSKFLGGVFVSCKTCNIPGKGPLKIEILKNKTPILFIGIDSQIGSGSWFHDIIKIFVSVAQQLSLSNKQSECDKEDVRDKNIKQLLDKIVPMVERINKTRMFIDRIRSTHLAAAIDASTHADEELRCLIIELSEIQLFSDKVRQ